MVYVCNGLGVLPMLNQVKELALTASSSVKTMSVVWINESPAEFFPLAYGDLEALFYKHNKKLDVSCCLESDVYAGSLGANDDVVSSVPEWGEGTMAVVAGPDYFVKKANIFLQGKGYPADCVCALG